MDTPRALRTLTSTSPTQVKRHAVSMAPRLMDEPCTLSMLSSAITPRDSKVGSSQVAEVDMEVATEVVAEDMEGTPQEETSEQIHLAIALKKR